jgi:hypothetical protein
MLTLGLSGKIQIATQEKMDIIDRVGKVYLAKG